MSKLNVLKSARWHSSKPAHVYARAHKRARVRALFSLPLAAVLWLLIVGQSAFAYEGQHHQQLTFLAAKQFNHCVAESAIPMLTALQVRYIARSNVGLAESNFFVRMFRWGYYDREDQSEHSLLWLIDTRFHEHFNEILERLGRARDPVQIYRDLGRILGYVQSVTSPAHAVPVYTARFWRLSFSDRFDNYPVDEASLEAALGDDCSFLEQWYDSYEDILRASATNTLAAVTAPIAGMPVSWEAFWTLGEETGDFGEYGPAGNSFGRSTSFRCGGGQRCVLLNDDPLYAEFALQRHLQAIRSSLAAMQLMQRALVENASAQAP